MTDFIWNSDGATDDTDDILSFMGGGSLSKIPPLTTIKPAPIKKGAAERTTKSSRDIPQISHPSTYDEEEDSKVQESKSPFKIIRKVKRKAEDNTLISGQPKRILKIAKNETENCGTDKIMCSLSSNELDVTDNVLHAKEDLIPQPSDGVPPASREKHKSLTIAEDPMQYHAKPKDLSRNALKRPREGDEPGDSTRRKPVGDGGGGDKSSHTFARSKFDSISLHMRVVEHLTKATDSGGFGLTKSTCVQSAVIPLLAGINRQNVLMKSQTGSGKTLAYLLPIVNDFLSMQPPIQRNEGTRALIIAPTRELCGQIADVLDKLTQCCVNIVGGSITGGEKKKSEKARLRKGIVILVGTPGRLLDHLKTTESFRLPLLRWVVLDEADRLLDMGFEQTILETLSIVRGERLPGLKPPSDKDKERALKNASGTLQQRWSRQSSEKAKICGNTNDIVHLMASATLTWGVKQLAMPVMGGARFAVVDADRETVVYVETKDDLLKLGGGASTEDGKRHEKDEKVEQTGGYVDFGNDDADEKKENGDGDADEVEGKSKKGRIDKTTTSLVKGEAIEAPQQLAQYYMMVTCKWRLAALVCFLRAHVHQKVVVFFATCDSVDFHSLLLREADWPLELDPGVDYSALSDGDNGEGGSKEAAALASMNQVLEPLPSHFTGMFGKQSNLYRLHGSVPQQGRQAVFREFCAAKTGVLFCTDVAARGLDLPRVDWILQYDPPCETADYVHRVGRTARRGLGGSALLFLLPSEANYTQLLSSHNLYPEPLSLQSLFTDTAQFIPGSSKFKNTDEMTAVILQRRLESVVHGNYPLLGAARQTFRSFVRAYATHSSDTKGIFSVQVLHLGHVAKSFGLRESPKALRHRDDIIAKIFNGSFTSTAIVKNSKMTKQERDDKYKLSGPSGGGVKKQSKDKQKMRKMGKSSNRSNSSSGMAPSGKFRKAGSGGYFRKRLREQTNSEFAK